MAEDPVVRQGDLGYIENNPSRPVVQLASECHGQHDLSLWLTPPRVDPLECTRLLEGSIRDLQPSYHNGRDQVQAGPTVYQHLCHPEVADCW